MVANTATIMRIFWNSFDGSAMHKNESLKGDSLVGSHFFLISRHIKPLDLELRVYGQMYLP